MKIMGITIIDTREIAIIITESDLASKGNYYIVNPLCSDDTDSENIESVRCDQIVKEQNVPLDKELLCVVARSDGEGWKVCDFYLDGFLSDYESVQGIVSSLYDDQEEVVCGVSCEIPGSGKNIEAILNADVLAEAGLLSIPEGYAVEVNLKRTNMVFEVISLLSPLAQDVLPPDPTQASLSVNAFANQAWKKPRKNNKSEQPKLIPMGVVIDEAQPVLRIDIHPKYVSGAGVSSLDRRPKGYMENIGATDQLDQWDKALKDNKWTRDIWFLNINIEWKDVENQWVYVKVLSPRANRLPETENEIIPWVEGTLVIEKDSTKTLNNRGEHNCYFHYKSAKGLGSGITNCRYSFDFDLLAGAEINSKVRIPTAVALRSKYEKMEHKWVIQTFHRIDLSAIDSARESSSK